MKFNKLLLAIALAPLAVQAEEILPLEIVTATGYPVSLDKVLASAEIISTDEIQRTAANDIADILRFHAGIELGRNGGSGQTTSLFIRGTESDHTLVLLDGVPINSASVGSAAVQNIDPQTIERIEIVKGPQSVLWGSGAIGGVVNIITRKSETKTLSYGGSIEGGSDNTFRSNARFAQGGSNWQGDASLSYNRTDGFPTFKASDIDAGYENITFNLGLAVDAGNGQVSARHWQTQGNNEYLDFFLNPLDQDFLNSSSRLSWNSAITDDWQSDLSLSHIRDHIEQNQSDESVKTDRSTLSWRNDLSVGDSDTWVLGVDYHQEDVTIEGGWAPFSNDIDYWEIYTQYDAWIGQDHHLNLGARHLDHETAGTQFTWSASYGYQFSDATRFSASAATGFKVPTANERYGFGGNPDLKPEESISYELSIKHDLSTSQNIALAIYRNDIDNLIQWVLVTPPFSGHNQNIAETRIDGLELSYKLATGSWSLNLNSVWQDPVDKDTDTQLLRRARYNLNGRLGFQWNNWTLGSSVLYADDRKDFGGITLDSYTLVNLDLSYALNQDWSVYGKVENLFDEDYELASGYNTQGLTGFVGVRFR